MPYTNKNAWQQAQHDSQSLKRVHAHLTQGTLPSKKAKHIRDVKHYLNISSIDNNGLLVVKKPDPFLMWTCSRRTSSKMTFFGH